MATASYQVSTAAPALKKRCIQISLKSFLGFPETITNLTPLSKLSASNYDHIK
jgi:hypothetical protein